MESIKHFSLNILDRFTYPEKSAEEFTVYTVAISFFSGVGTYYYPGSFTASILSAGLISLKLPSKNSQPTEKELKVFERTIFLTKMIVIGSCIGYLSHYERYNRDQSFFRPTLRTPIHLFLYSVTFQTVHSQSNYSLGRLSLAPHIYEGLNPHKPNDTLKITLIAAALFTAIATYFCPLLSIFSHPLVYQIEMSVVEQGESSVQEDSTFQRRVLLLSSIVLVSGTLTHHLTASSHFSYKTPIHLVNLLYGALFLWGRNKIGDESNLDSLGITIVPPEYKPTELNRTDSKMRASNLVSLESRYGELERLGFPFGNPTQVNIKSRKACAAYLLFVDQGWEQKKMKNNYMALIRCSNSDTTQVDRNIYQAVLSAAKILEFTNITQAG